MTDCVSLFLFFFVSTEDDFAGLLLLDAGLLLLDAEAGDLFVVGETFLTGDDFEGDDVERVPSLPVSRGF